MTKPKKPAVKKEAPPKIAVSAMQVFSAQQKIAAKHLTTDSFENFASRLGVNNNNALSNGTYEFNLITRNRVILEAAYRGSWLVGAIIDSIADDMTRAGIEFTTNDSEEEIKDFNTYISRKKIWQSLNYLIKWGDLYGGAIAVMQIRGQKLDTPLDPSTVSKDQFQGLVVYDRWQLNPDLQNLIQEGPDMGLPLFYNIVTSSTAMNANNQNQSGQIKVHYSRCIRYTGIDLPYFQAVTEMMWGESVLERLWDRMISFDNATMSSASLIDRANLRTVGIDGLRDIIGAGDAAMNGLLAQFEMIRLMQVNEGLTLLDKEDTMTSTAYSFAGLSDMMLQFMQQISGASKIPLVRLLGQSPAGLNSTGDADIRMYYDNINAKQEAKLRDPWEMLVKVLWASKFGVPAPKDLDFSFSPLWQMSATDKASIAKSTAETIAGAEEKGLISKPSAMKELRDSAGETGLFSNITDEEITEAEMEPPPMPDAEPPPEEKPVDKKDKAADSAFGRIKSWLSKH